MIDFVILILSMVNLGVGFFFGWQVSHYLALIFVVPCSPDFYHDRPDLDRVRWVSIRRTEQSGLPQVQHEDDEEKPDYPGYEPRPQAALIRFVYVKLRPAVPFGNISEC